MSGIEAPSARHDDAELFMAIEGSAIVVTGGKLHEEHIAGGNILGHGIDGGQSARLNKGDMILVPGDMPHLVIPQNGPFPVMSIHIPHVKL
jgi:hypothetical protein